MRPASTCWNCTARTAKVLKTKGVDVIDCSSGGITEMAPILGKEIRYSYQVPLSEYVKLNADIMTMAVGLIIHGDQAEQILRDKQADLIAVGRRVRRKSTSAHGAPPQA